MDPTPVSSACLLFFNPEDAETKVYALSYPKNLNELPDLKKFLKASGIEDIQDCLDIPSQYAVNLVADEIWIAVNTPPSPSFIVCKKSHHYLVPIWFKNTKLRSELLLLTEDSLKKDSLISKNSLNPLKKILAFRANIPFFDSEGGTLLHFAAEKGQDALFEVLLEFGADVNRETNYGETVLHSALKVAHPHNLSFAQKIIIKGGSVNAVTTEGRVTPLHYALKLEDKSVEVVEFLVQSGANVHAISFMGSTPLIRAYKNPKVIQVLINKGAQLDAENLHGQTVLLEAVFNIYFESAEYIVNLRPNPSVGGNKEAFYTALSKYSSKGAAKLVRLMLQRGFSVSQDDIKKRDVLIGAIRHGLADVVQSLLEMGLAVNHQGYDVKGHQAEAPIHFAVEENQEHIVRLLIQHGADVNARYSAKHKTPLAVAVYGGHIELVKLLFEAKANDRTDPKLLSYALEGAQLDILKFLLESGLEPNYVDDDGKTCVSSITKPYATEFMDCLIEFGTRFRCFDVIGLYLSDRDSQTLLGYCSGNIAAAGLEKLSTSFKINSFISNFERHLVKLETLNPESETLKHLESRLLEIRYEHGKFVQKCQAEAKKLEETINGTSLKYRDVLMSVERTTRYVNNPSVVKALKKKLVKRRFPIYSNMLKGQFRLAVLRKTLEDQVLPIMRTLLSQFSPPHQQEPLSLADELIEVIISYLSVRDLVVLQKFFFNKQSSNSSS